MRYLVFILVFLLKPAWAETATDRAKLYFADIENKKFSAAAEHFEPTQLKEFRRMMEFYKEIPPEAQTQFIQTFFGAEQDIKSIAKLNDVEFFSGLFNFIIKQADAAGGLNFNGLEILGEVREGKDIAHLVTRNRVNAGEVKIEAMEVVSLKKIDKEWRVLLSGKIQGLPQQLKSAFSAKK